MEEGASDICPFGMLFSRNVPHIIEKIFLYLDTYNDCIYCLQVNKTWKKFILTSKPLTDRWLLDAVYHGHADVLEILLSLGIDPEADVNRDGSGRTVLTYAASRGDIDVVRVLLRGGANPNAIGTVEDEEWTPIVMAAKSCHKDVVALLLNGGANPNMGKTNGIAAGMSPLHWAAFHGHKAILQMLLGCGADTTKEDGNGQTPMKVAESQVPKLGFGEIGYSWEIVNNLKVHEENLQEEDED